MKPITIASALAILRAMDDKWITTKPSSGKGKHILLGPGGEIKGGSVPRSAHGKNIRSWAKQMAQAARGEITMAPRNIQRKEGESDEEYQKRARKERAAMRKAEKQTPPSPPEPVEPGKKTPERKSSPRKPGETDEEYKKRAARERRERRRKELQEAMGKTPQEPDEVPKKEEKPAAKKGQNDQRFEKAQEDKDKISNFVDSLVAQSLRDPMESMSLAKGLREYLSKTANLGRVPLTSITPSPYSQGYISEESLNKKLNEVQKYLPAHIAEALNQSPVGLVILNSSRASADVNNIYISNNDTPSTIAHELMHVAERRMKVLNREENGKYGEKTLGWINSRWIRTRAKEGEKIVPLGPPYGREEKAVKDGFYNPYVGKQYKEDVTEVLSMGIELLHEPQKLRTAIRKDPKTVRHIIQCLTPGAAFNFELVKKQLKEGKL